MANTTALPWVYGFPRYGYGMGMGIEVCDQSSRAYGDSMDIFQ